MEASEKIQRDFQGNIIWVLFLNAFIKPIYLLVIDRGVQNVLPPEEYGVYFTLFNLSFILQMVADFGIQAWLTRTCALDTYEAKKQYPLFLSLKGILSIFYLILTGLIAFFLGFWSKYPTILTLVLLLQLSNSFLLFLRATVSGIGLYRFDSFLSVIDRGFSIVVMGFFLFFPSFRSKITISLFASVQLVGLLLSIFIAIQWLSKNNFTFKPRFELKKLTNLIKEGLPYAILVLLMSISSRLDTLIIPFLSTDKFSGSAIYASGYRILEATNIIGYLFAGLLLPLFTKGIKERSITSQLSNMALRILWTITLPIAIGGSIFSAEIIPILYKNATHEMSNTFGILILALIPISGNYIYGTLLTASGSLWKMNRIFVLVLLINIVLITSLLPLFSIPGAALATLITQTIAFLFQVNLCLKKELVNYSLSLLIRIFLFAIGIGSSLFLVKFLIPLNINTIFMIIPIGIIFFGILMILTGMIKKNEWMLLFKETVR